ncbi:hypothetical protein Salat_1455700 [Sesamum alatum]|uniref:Uncharacterized protein n=1 Tax=Sesamum alatum TaxID=300844 RepID=A0AAE1YBA0_9LAMI|nr:hypothetical protein Salat_1455700 [Sesamum alatum]
MRQVSRINVTFLQHGRVVVVRQGTDNPLSQFKSGCCLINLFLLELAKLEEPSAGVEEVALWRFFKVAFLSGRESRKEFQLCYSLVSEPPAINRASFPPRTQDVITTGELKNSARDTFSLKARTQYHRRKASQS